MTVLIVHGGFGRGLSDSQMVEIPCRGLQAVTDVPNRRAVRKLTENHADKLPPSVKPIAKFVGAVLVNDTPNYFLGRVLLLVQKVLSLPT